MPDIPVKVNLVKKRLPLIKVLMDARQNVLTLLPEIATRQPIVAGRTIAPWFMLMDPQTIRSLFIEKLDIYPKSDVTKNLLRPAIGKSIFIVEGEEWRWQRRAAAPVLTCATLKTCRL